MLCTSSQWNKVKRFSYLCRQADIMYYLARKVLAELHCSLNRRMKQSLIYTQSTIQLLQNNVTVLRFVFVWLYETGVVEVFIHFGTWLLFRMSRLVYRGVIKTLKANLSQTYFCTALSESCSLRVKWSNNLDWSAAVTRLKLFLECPAEARKMVLRGLFIYSEFFKKSRNEDG